MHANCPRTLLISAAHMYRTRMTTAYAAQWAVRKNHICGD